MLKQRRWVYYVSGRNWIANSKYSWISINQKHEHILTRSNIFLGPLNLQTLSYTLKLEDLDR